MIITSDTIFNTVAGSLNHNIPTDAISAVPSAEKIAYAVPTSICFSAWLKAKKLNPYSRIISSTGPRFIKPSDNFNDSVPPTSKTIALNK